MDNQINVPRCEKCKISWSKTCPLIIWNGFNLCGSCLMIVIKKEQDEKRKFITG